MRNAKPGAASVLSLVLVVILVAIGVGCGAEDGTAAGRSSPEPAGFADESWAELASDGGEDLWLAVAGYRRSGDFGLRIFRRGAHDWEEAPVPPGKVSQDLPISIAVPGSAGAPCLGYSAGSRPAPVVACLDAGNWRPLDLPPLHGGQLVQIATHDGDLVALFAKQEPGASRYWLLRNAGGAWTSTPQFSAPAAIAQLASESPDETAANFPAIGVTTQGRSSQHFVAELRDGGWHRLQPALQGLGTGPFVGGPVLFGGRIFYPVNEADAEPWSFSVHTARIGSTEARPERLSADAGNAQGRLDLVGGRVWATWQEQDPRKGGGFQTGVFAAELTPKGRLRRKVRLWRGVSIGPGSIQIVEFQGRTLALYMRSSSNGRGLQETVTNLP